MQSSVQERAAPLLGPLRLHEQNESSDSSLVKILPELGCLNLYCLNEIYAVSEKTVPFPCFFVFFC